MDAFSCRERAGVRPRCLKTTSLGFLYLRPRQTWQMHLSRGPALRPLRAPSAKKTRPAHPGGRLQHGAPGGGFVLRAQQRQGWRGCFVGGLRGAAMCCAAVPVPTVPVPGCPAAGEVPPWYPLSYGPSSSSLFSFGYNSWKLVECEFNCFRESLRLPVSMGPWGESAETRTHVSSSPAAVLWELVGRCVWSGLPVDSAGRLERRLDAAQGRDSGRERKGSTVRASTRAAPSSGNPRERRARARGAVGGRRDGVESRAGGGLTGVCSVHRPAGRTRCSGG